MTFHPCPLSHSQSNVSTVLAATIQAIFEFIMKSEPTPAVFLLHLETLNLLLVMASTQLTSSVGTTGSDAHPFLVRNNPTAGSAIVLAISGFTSMHVA